MYHPLAIELRVKNLLKRSPPTLHRGVSLLVTVECCSVCENSSITSSVRIKDNPDDVIEAIYHLISQVCGLKCRVLLV